MEFGLVASDIVHGKTQGRSQKKNGSFLLDIQAFLKIKKIQDEPNKKEI